MRRESRAKAPRRKEGSHWPLLLPFGPSFSEDFGLASLLTLTGLVGILAQTKVGEVPQRLRDDGWYLVATRGSHRQFKHPTRPGRVTVPGKPNDDLAPATQGSIFKQAGWRK